jgi:ligand-binding SRPBCC domain-containing protein
MSAYILERWQEVPRPLDEVFAFFADAGNLEAITPPLLRFRVLTPQPITMRAGVVITYQLHLYGMPLRWRTVIADWRPGERFIDVQMRGPYRSWRHLHEFQATPVGTRIHDYVTYRLPFGQLGALFGSPLVRRSLQAIFDYRQQVIAQRFGVVPTASTAERT